MQEFCGRSYNGCCLRQGEFMAEKWKIISNSSDHLILERGNEQIDIPKPEEPAAEELFLKMKPPGSVTDVGVELFMKSKNAS
jgi:hypothetical protein